MASGDAPVAKFCFLCLSKCWQEPQKDFLGIEIELNKMYTKMQKNRHAKNGIIIIATQAGKQSCCCA